MKLADLFTPEEFAAFISRPKTGIEQEVKDYVYECIDLMQEWGGLTGEEVMNTATTLGLIDKLLREKTGESKSVN